MSNSLLLKNYKISPFYLAYIMYYSGLIIQHTTFVYTHVLKTVCSLLTLVLLAIEILSHNKFFYVKKKRFGIFLIGCIVLILSMMAKDIFLIVLLAFALSIKTKKKIDINKLLRLSIKITIIIIIITVFFCIVGVIPNIVTARDYGQSGRYGYGFEHSQTISLLYTYAVLYYYIIEKKITWKSFLVNQLISFILFLIFDARNARYSIELLYLLYIVYAAMNKINKNSINILVYYASSISTILVTFVSFALMYLYTRGNTFARYIDLLLTRRISLPLKTFNLSSIKIIKIMSYSNYQNALQSTMDNGYYYIVFRYGLIYICFLWISSWYVSMEFKTQKNVIGALCFMTIAVSGAIANPFATCFFFPFWIIAFCIMTSLKKPLKTVQIK